MHRSERGYSLLETTVGVALAAAIAGAAGHAVAVTLHASSRETLASALETEVRRQIPVAVDILKYRGGTIAPAVVATTLPIPAGTPLPAVVSISVERVGPQARRITIDVSAAGQHLSAGYDLTHQSLLPGSTQYRPGLVAAPTGAP